MKHGFITDGGLYGVAWHELLNYQVMVTEKKFADKLSALSWLAEKLGGPIQWGNKDAREWARMHVQKGRFMYLEETNG